MKHFLTLVAFLLTPFGGANAAVSSAQGRSEAKTVGGKPNIILIYSDDHGFADLGAQGVDTDIRTPNLDALSFIKRHARDPFFLYLAYFTPHVPLESPEPWFSKTPANLPKERRQALAMNVASCEWIASAEWQEVKTGLTVKGTLLHLRMTLPSDSSGIEVQSITLIPSKGKQSIFDFSKASSAP